MYLLKKLVKKVSLILDISKTYLDISKIWVDHSKVRKWLFKYKTKLKNLQNRNTLKQILVIIFTLCERKIGTNSNLPKHKYPNQNFKIQMLKSKFGTLIPKFKKKKNTKHVQSKFENPNLKIYQSTTLKFYSREVFWGCVVREIVFNITTNHMVIYVS